jgi:hypothetical protein
MARPYTDIQTTEAYLQADPTENLKVMGTVVPLTIDSESRTC